MKRKFLAVVELDEDILKDNDAPGEYLEREFGWLEQSGITLKDWLITDDDDEVRWARYANYLIEWAFEHSGEEYEGMSPACYDEWCDNEDEYSDANEQYVYAVVLGWGTEDSTPDNEVIGIYRNFGSARQAFLEQRKEEVGIAEDNGWKVYEDGDCCYDAGEDGSYNDNHSRLYIAKIKLEV